MTFSFILKSLKFFKNYVENIRHKSIILFGNNTSEGSKKQGNVPISIELPDHKAKRNFQHCMKMGV